MTNIKPTKSDIIVPFFKGSKISNITLLAAKNYFNRLFTHLTKWHEQGRNEKV